MSRGESHLLENLPINKKTGKIMDLYRLYAAMTRRGGSSKVVKDKKMKGVASYMGLNPDNSEIVSALKIIYRKYLYAFEQKAMFHRDVPIVRVASYLHIMYSYKTKSKFPGQRRSEAQDNTR